jgi:cytochrome c-type biogenesis protein CcmH/NrfG
MAEATASIDLTALQEQLNRKPEDLGSHTRLGWAQFSLQEYDQASRTFENAYKRWPEDIEVNYGLGLAFKMQGKQKEALDSFQRAEVIKPDSVRSSMLSKLAAEQKEYLLQMV